jgi:glycosyltransferase involved in cell wall biosynthesis
MKICYFGNYQTQGRSRVLRTVLQEEGYEILDCRSELNGLSFYFDLFKRLRALAPDYDLVFIGNCGPSYFLPLFAQMITRKPIVWEPLFSIYDNYVHDRKLAPRFSVKALYYFLMDMISSFASDAIILDTHENCTYFSKTFKVSPKKLFRVLIGADTAVFTPAPYEEGDVFEVEFHGKYIPVQGTDVIVRAAKLLESDEKIHITMIGGGQTYRATKNLARELEVKNITFLPFLPPTEVRDHIARAHVCIGLLGDVPRIEGAIPNKVYEAAAMGRVSINADTIALREVFVPGIDILTVPRGEHHSLAETILKLKESGTAKELGVKARHTFETKSSYSVISSELRCVFEYVCKKV